MHSRQPARTTDRRQSEHCDESVIESVEKLAAKDARSYLLQRKQEASAPRRLLPLALPIKPSTGDQRVHVHMSAQVLGPGMQHQTEGRHRAEPSGIVREL